MEIQARQNRGSSLPAHKIFVKNLYRDEIRSGFLVTSHRKKLWNVQIGLINEFARVCKKYNLRWFASGGTLLGAVRHGGFIPWDDDVDVRMFRPDYNKLVKIAAKEFKYPYFLDNWYDYQREVEMSSSTLRDLSLQLINKEVEDKYPICWPFTPFLKLRDLRTTMLGIPEARETNQCIFMDIFPMDAFSSLSEDKNYIKFLQSLIFLIAATYPKKIRKLIDEDNQSPSLKNALEIFLSLPYRQRGIFFDDLADKNFNDSEKVGLFWDYLVKGHLKDTHEKRFFEKTVYLPFESIEIPAPFMYEEFLNILFGDWHKFVIYPSHSSEYSVDIPYAEYYRNSSRMR